MSYFFQAGPDQALSSALVNNVFGFAMKMSAAAIIESLITYTFLAWPVVMGVETSKALMDGVFLALSVLIPVATSFFVRQDFSSKYIKDNDKLIDLESNEPLISRKAVVRRIVGASTFSSFVMPAVASVIAGTSACSTLPYCIGGVFMTINSLWQYLVGPDLGAHFNHAIYSDARAEHVPDAHIQRVIGPEVTEQLPSQCARLAKLFCSENGMTRGVLAMYSPIN